MHICIKTYEKCSFKKQTKKEAAVCQSCQMRAGIDLETHFFEIVMNSVAVLVLTFFMCLCLLLRMSTVPLWQIYAEPSHWPIHSTLCQKQVDVANKQHAKDQNMIN